MRERRGQLNRNDFQKKTEHGFVRLLGKHRDRWRWFLTDPRRKRSERLDGRPRK